MVMWAIVRLGVPAIAWISILSKEWRLASTNTSLIARVGNNRASPKYQAEEHHHYHDLQHSLLASSTCPSSKWEANGIRSVYFPELFLVNDPPEMNHTLPFLPSLDDHCLLVRLSLTEWAHKLVYHFFILKFVCVWNCILFSIVHILPWKCNMA